MINNLPLIVEHQEHHGWCWAAVSNSVSHFYEGNTSPWTQCKIVDKGLPGNNCCNNGGSDACNEGVELDRGLKIVGHFKSAAAAPGNVNDPILQDIIASINIGQPVCARVAFSDIHSHAVAIAGFDPAKNQFTISDPLWDMRIGVPFDQFLANYLNAGSWTDTYFTQK